MTKKNKRRSSPSKKNLREPSPPLPPGRRWLFRLLAFVVLPVVLLAVVATLLEIGLRIGGYGYDPHFFRSIRIDGQEYFINNEKFSLRFFPAPLARWPDPFVFPAQKAPDTVRIFIFGESAAMGDPHPAYGAGRYLEVLLRERFPGKKFEVINLGITAINSHVILPIARECAAQGGDFWIIYMGNNEMVGPFGAATVFGAQATPRRVAQMNLAIQRTRVGQLLVAALRNLRGNSGNASWGGMEMFLENQIAPGDPRKETVYENFAGNLHDIVAAGVGAGAKVILNTVSVNLKDSPPFASATNSNSPASDRERFSQLFSEGKLLQSHGDFGAAAGRFAQAIQLQPAFAETHFRLAQCDLALTNADAAKEFQSACDLDALPFRADTRVNAAIRHEAEREASRLEFCDAERNLAETTAARAAGDETFFEHVHFNFDGNYRLGKLWAEDIARHLPAPNSKPNWSSQADCDRDLGLTIWNRHFVLQSVIHRMEQPPLSTQFNNAERLQQIVAEDARLCQQQAAPGAVQQVRAEFAAAIQRAPADACLYAGLANFLEAVNQPQDAQAAYRKLYELRPESFYACLQLGRILGELGKPADGQPFLENATRLRPSMPDAWFELGNVLAAQSRFEPALAAFGHAAQLRPQDSSYVVAAAQMLARMNRHAEAVERFRQAVQLNPGDWEAHFELGGELVAANQPSEAIAEYTAALKFNPNHVESHINLGVVLVRLNRLEEATACFQAALKLAPDNQAAQAYLASVLEHQKALKR